MSKVTTGKSGESLTQRVKREIEELYAPTASELKIKHTFYHRLKHGVWSGTPKEKWNRPFVEQVTGASVNAERWGQADFQAWFRNEDSYAETKAASLEGAMHVIMEVMNSPAERAGDRLRAAEMALKLNKAFEEAADNSKSGGFSDAEIAELEKQGIDIKLIKGR